MLLMHKKYHLRYFKPYVPQKRVQNGPSNQLEVGKETQITRTKKCMIDNWKEKQLTLLGTVSLAFYVKCSPGEDIHSHNLILIQ